LVYFFVFIIENARSKKQNTYEYGNMLNPGSAFHFSLFKTTRV